jgi:hypothetical protein
MLAIVLRVPFSSYSRKGKSLNSFPPSGCGFCYCFAVRIYTFTTIFAPEIDAKKERRGCETWLDMNVSGDFKNVLYILNMKGTPKGIPYGILFFGPRSCTRTPPRIHWPPQIQTVANCAFVGTSPPIPSSGPCCVRHAVTAWVSPSPPGRVRTQLAK